jgi:hypothetical protein
MLMNDKPPDPLEDTPIRWCKQCQRLTALREWILGAPPYATWFWVHESCGEAEFIPEKVQ